MMCDWWLYLAHSANAADSTFEIVRLGLNLHRTQLYQSSVNCRQTEL